MRVKSRVLAILVVAGLAGPIAALSSPSMAAAAPGTVVISQVYGGGGNSGAPLSNDYVELFNRSAAPVSLDGWSVQYTSATGTGNFASNKADLSGTLAPGQYHLVQLAAGTTPSGALPQPDSVGSINMGGTAGKVALVRSAEGLACNGSTAPCSDDQLAQLADLVGYGTANFSEGTAAPALTNATAGLRKGGGCADTDDNAADFETGAPAPRNSATAPAPCGGGEPSPTPTPTPTPTPAESCDTPATHQIPQVQGNGEASPVAGQNVRVEGVVTGDFQGSGGLGGFYVQAARPDADPATSEGLFVFSSTPVKAGDRVLVSGKAIEYNGLTEISPATAVNVCGTGTVRRTEIDLPLRKDVTFERYEGMLVTFDDDLAISETYNLARYGELLLAEDERLFQPTDREGVDTARDARRRILLDDGSNAQNPATLPYHTQGSNTVRVGDEVRDLTGILTYGFDVYRVQPTAPVVFRAENPRPARPERVGGDVRVASLNTLNWFTTLGSRGATTAEERDRQLAKLVATITTLDPAVAGLMEVERNDDVALNALVDALNAKAGAGTYQAITHPNPGTDLIQTALIYQPARVTPIGPARSSSDPIFNRPPLVQTFGKANGRGKTFTVLVNHFKSKGCTDSDGPATGADADQGDRQSCYNAKRVKQAQAVLSLIGELKLKNALVLGDINAYGEEDPIHAFEDGGLTSLSKKYVKKDDRYSYVFDGLSGELDHVLADKGARKLVTGATIWHVNADEGRFMDYNTEYNPPYLYAPDPFRSSDHDPLLVGVRL
ncbi:ExeM/NucH family extracellular endonuclease [Nonomuraea sp. FMUSA5-5]|uniref:ExeM/NucH family extracellular endonuclease n=1 Tax=Nonomuraea composti TaxID=2720023 RepID=A0ABX1B8U7_9ACTN|nr:ExeM/NucH family extracellular endonuclease [Nonomuraea sp. FMUSA5-5]NJP94245.1 ExeM/NucH family extracellular endonuclease [Nonomuraea sp. FMUSA5-5]